MSKKMLMLGNEAIARGAYEAGIKLSSAYPGTPSTEISESIAKYSNIYAEWSPNEKVAMEVAIGASFSGVRALVSMKHVGLNVASDPLYSVAYAGINGALVIVVADDPGIYSSQNEQDTRMIARAAQVPLLEPADSHEAKEYVKFACDLSEAYDTPVIIRTTTRLSHSQSLVRIKKPGIISDKPYIKNIAKNVMLPGFANQRHKLVEKRNEKLTKDGACFPINKVEYNDLNIGVITSGIPYQYVKEALPNASILKLGIINPLPESLIREFAEKIDNLYIVEELEPVIEEQVRAWGIAVNGKKLFTRQGEYSANMIRNIIGNQPVNILKKKKSPNRPPVLCPGCSHRSIYIALKKLGVHASGDIGCYTLGALSPLSVVDTTVCMGASISMLHGMEKAKGKDYIKNWVAIIGDSTFMHTGINSLINMVYNKSTGTVIVLDNSTTGMTGQQGHAGSGLTLNAEETYKISISNVCQAIGVKNVVEIDAFDIKSIEEVVKKELVKDELSVIITKAPCVMLKRDRNKKKYEIDQESCSQCLKCVRTGCPAIMIKDDRQVKINQTSCNACGLCYSVCSFKAINEFECNL